MIELPPKEQLQKAWEDLKKLHKIYLNKYGVKIPIGKEFNSSGKAVWLSVLHYNKEKEVHKDDISKITQVHIPKAGSDQQVRHLKRDGWDIGSKRGVHKLNPYYPSLEFMNMSNTKNKRLKSNDFEEIKADFGGRCATCGADEGKPNPRYGSNVVKLQQGHQDPLESGNEPKNIIPQCQFCNQTYKKDFVFDEKGRVKAVASIAPVKRARRIVQEQVFDWLKNKNFKQAS
ncbi:MAG: hypothetical protein OXK80_05795 [Bdellovibrionales bacterium]|nr:hypothetical protein [Bdellovibrionales bacterium]